MKHALAVVAFVVATFVVVGAQLPIPYPGLPVLTTPSGSANVGAAGVVSFGPDTCLKRGAQSGSLVIDNCAGGVGTLYGGTSLQVGINGATATWTFSNVGGLISAATYPVQPGSTTFANLAANSPTNGMLLYCSDCTIANPCAGGGSGALAKRLNGIQVCN